MVAAVAGSSPKKKEKTTKVIDNFMIIWLVVWQIEILNQAARHSFATAKLISIIIEVRMNGPMGGTFHCTC